MEKNKGEAQIIFLIFGIERVTARPSDGLGDVIPKVAFNIFWQW